MDRSCKPSKKYTRQTDDGDPSKCEKLAWATKFSTIGKTSDAVWAAESTDGSYYAVGGFTENDIKGAESTLWKLDAATGKILW